MSKTTEEALQIDKIAGNDFWRKVINKEISKVKTAWKVDDGHNPSEARAATATAFVGFQEIGCHLFFDVKMDFTQILSDIKSPETQQMQSPFPP